MNYTSNKTPGNYICADCNAKGVKLWRRYQTALDKKSLRCASCSCKNQNTKDDIDKDGSHLDRYNSYSNSIGWLVPAIPTLEGDAYWGHTSAPQNSVDWWVKLPTRGGLEVYELEDNLEDFIPRYYKLRRYFFMSLVGVFYITRNIMLWPLGLISFIILWPFLVADGWFKGRYHNYKHFFITNSRPYVVLGNSLFSSRRIKKELSYGFNYEGAAMDKNGNVVLKRQKRSFVGAARKISGEEWTVR